MDEPFYANGLKFSCQRCSSCCRFDPGFVQLSEKDLESLMSWSSLSREDFIGKYCRWLLQADGCEYLCLLEKPGYDCILWDNGCIAYGARPFQCSSYPFWPSLLTDEDWWEANAQDCPGVNHGVTHGRDEIEAYLTRRRLEPYIRRKVQK
jgi:Fe-S-cluster containining protein